ncbi:hypothetical protein BCV72DRAFT_229883 [Rhizopus microsporus var. microsporus]|uniref:Uncharacterized protein n=2 Tax=Rhizopus microsporus TaxID=58291 RepID=A0A2G4TAI7_RHIZD|nr:uncharacterized protein RHIMIDRAFT_255357 [Rhizopus microsporus ATCC 52813]ORE05427.1 hypothetical protein BCV72DRAFT_229883 [Rhizopus microsporus var. microsporus]PHZ18015.1 hypothetical protein RHIMIDRAFT_255357 [Rhizopus microsporus ATCC 52813]
MSRGGVFLHIIGLNGLVYDSKTNLCYVFNYLYSLIFFQNICSKLKKKNSKYWQ